MTSPRVNGGLAAGPGSCSLTGSKVMVQAAGNQGGCCRLHLKKDVHGGGGVNVAFGRGLGRHGHGGRGRRRGRPSEAPARPLRLAIRHPRATGKKVSTWIRGDLTASVRNPRSKKTWGRSGLRGCLLVTRHMDPRGGCGGRRAGLCRVLGGGDAPKWPKPRDCVSGDTDAWALKTWLGWSRG